ncbi:Chromosome partition protein Smc [subsurface metagenome]
MNRINNEISEVEANFQYLTSDFEILGIKKNEIEEVIKEKSKKIQILSKIKKDIKIWEKVKNEIDELQKSITVLESDLEQTSESIIKEDSFIKKYEEEHFEVKQKLEKLTSNKAQLSRLLDEIERYIKNGVCPVCGTDHKSKDNLLEKIHKQKKTRPEQLEELVKKSQELKNSIEKRKELVTKLKHTQEVKNDEIKDLSDELNEKQETIEKFESLIEQANLSMDEKKLNETVIKLLDEKYSTLDAIKDKLKEINKEESNKSKQKTEFKLKHKQLVENRQHANSKIEDLKKQLENYHLKAQELDMPLDISKAEFTLIQNEWAERESELGRRINELTQKGETLKEDIRKVEKLLSETLQNSESFSEDIEKLQSGLERYEEVVNRFIKEKEIGFENISELRKDTEERVNELQRLIHQILTLERALDSAELSVMVAELDSRITIKSNKKLQVEEEAKKFTELRKWFIKIKDVLNKQSSNAVENHVLTLGPLSSLIQKRLRTAYGFGDISLFPESNEIRVEVDYNGEKVKPTDYFSDSQKQILMLSLFLSGRLTQTWSGFVPILLDDPVTHFDDLNAFGFVELIRGLVSTSPGKRQFILSTCEERLFELMKSKFGKIKGGAIFYRFSGINTYGPIVTKIEH